MGGMRPVKRALHANFFVFSAISACYVFFAFFVSSFCSSSIFLLFFHWLDDMWRLVCA